MTYLAFRILFQQKRRLAISVGGVALAITLFVLLNGLLAGIYAQVTAYLENTPADLIVAQEGGCWRTPNDFCEARTPTPAKQRR